jgi:hypothetical protein
MVGFYAKKGETRNETFKRVYGTDCPIKQASIKRQERALALLKTNYYKREIELSTATREKKTYKHKSLNDLINRFTIKDKD